MYLIFYWEIIYLKNQQRQNMRVNLVGTAAHVKSSETRREFVYKTRLEHLHNYNMHINYGITGLKILCNGSSFIIKTLGI